jgi:hypothetical protein
MAKIKPPESLASEGQRVWKAVTSKYDLRADELVTLEDACAASDMIAALSDAWAEDGKPPTTKGSMGQQVIHPLIGEIRTQRAARNALFRQLKLPDDAASGSGESNQQRAAAQSRWAAAHGSGA